jgi:hypothetical protein
MNENREYPDTRPGCVHCENGDFPLNKAQPVNPPPLHSVRKSTSIGGEAQVPAAGGSAVRNTITFGGLSGKEWIIIVLLMIASVLLGMNFNRLDKIHSETIEQTRQTTLLNNHSEKLDKDVIVAKEVTLALASLTRCKP